MPAALDYTAADEKYVVRGDGTTPVVLVTPDGSGCRQHIGNTIEFFKGNDRVSVDGGTRNCIDQTFDTFDNVLLAFDPLMPSTLSTHDLTKSYSGRTGRARRQHRGRIG